MAFLFALSLLIPGVAGAATGSEPPRSTPEIRGPGAASPPPRPQPSPPAPPPTSARPPIEFDAAFRAKLAQAIWEEVEQIPGENKLKYGALAVLTMIPKTSAAAAAATKVEIIKDVAESTAIGMVKALDLPPRQRALAMARIAVLKGTGDWLSFLSDLAGITGIQLALLTATIPSTIEDLVKGFGAIEAHTDAVRYLLKTAESSREDCEFDVAKALFEETQGYLRRYIPAWIRDAAHAYAQLTQRPIPSTIVPETMPRTLRPTDYDPTLFNIFANRYMGNMNQYHTGLRYLEEIPRRLEVLDREATAYSIERKQVADRLRQAEELLWKCQPEQGGRILQEFRDKYLAQRYIRGPAIAKSEGCWGWAAKEYDRISGLYYEWSSLTSDRQRSRASLDAGLDALKQCKIEVAEARLLDISKLMLVSLGTCVRDFYGTLDTAIGKAGNDPKCIQQELPNTPAPQQIPSPPVGDCKGIREAHHRRCGDMAKKYSELACKRIYSGCALDVAGCLGAMIASAFPDPLCAKPGYLGCIEGPVQQYHADLIDCNDRFQARRLPEGLLNCRLKAQDRITAATKVCHASFRDR